MYCKNCGFPYPDGSRFCQNCGQPIEPEEMPVQTPEGVQTPAGAEQQPAVMQAAVPEPAAEPEPAANPENIQQPAMTQAPGAYMQQPAVMQAPAPNMQQPAMPQASGTYMQQPAMPQAPDTYMPQPEMAQAPGAYMQQPGAMQPSVQGMAPGPWMQDQAAAEAVRRVEEREHRKRTRHVFSRIGWAFVAIYLGTVVAQVAVVLILQLCGVDTNGTLAYWLASFLPQYLIGFPVGYLLLRGLPVFRPEPEQLQRFSAAKWLKLFVIAIFIGYGSSFVASMLGTLLQSLLGLSGNLNVLDSLFTDDSVLLEILFAVMIAPIVEELFFRKLIIDRTRGYGEMQAVLYSALIFGLFHGNLTQTVYAFALGLLLGYIYMRSGKLRYSIGIHMAFNFIGSVVSSVLLEKASLQMSSLGISEDMTSADFDRLVEILYDRGVSAIGWIMGYGLFLILLFGLMIAGLVLLIINLKRLKFYETAQQLRPGERAKLVWGNAGMIVFSVLLLGVLVVTFFAVG